MVTASERARRKAYDDTPKHRHDDMLRHRARRLMIKKYGAEALKGKDVDHRKPLRSGGTNVLSNLRIRSHAQRGWNKKGGID